MYTAVMACGLACAWAGSSAPLGHPLGCGLAAAALAGVLATKAILEERWMRSAHAGYAAYCKRTGRFLPGIL